ncbi:MAG: hypothetical protein RJA16_1885 [Planctomycetota bacterium]
MPRPHRSCPARFVRPALALVLGGGLGAASTASADVVASGMVNINIPSTEFGIVINLVTGESGTSYSVAGYDFQFSSQFTLQCDGSFDSPSNAFVRSFNGASGVNNLPLGTMVGPGLNLWTSSSQPSSNQSAANWVLSSGDNYIGVRFTNEATGELHYGWMRFCVAESFGAQPRSIVEYAYESTPNTAIAIGAGGTGMPADCGGAPTCATIPACGDSLPPTSNIIECVTLEAAPDCNNKLFYRDHDWQSAGQSPWRNTTWAGPAGSPVDVTLEGFNLETFQQDYFDLTFQTLNLRDVNLDPEGFTLILRGDQTAIDLDNARLVCVPVQPVWDALVPLSLSATAGASAFQGMQGLVGSSTTLSVSPGASLKFDACGQTAFGLPNSLRCFFGNSVNHADIDGGTLERCRIDARDRRARGRERQHPDGTRRRRHRRRHHAARRRHGDVRALLEHRVRTHHGARHDDDRHRLHRRHLDGPHQPHRHGRTGCPPDPRWRRDRERGHPVHGRGLLAQSEGDPHGVRRPGDHRVARELVGRWHHRDPRRELRPLRAGGLRGVLEDPDREPGLHQRRRRVPRIGRHLGQRRVRVVRRECHTRHRGLGRFDAADRRTDRVRPVDPVHRRARPTAEPLAATDHGNERADGNDVVLPAGTKFGILDYPAEDDFIGLFWKDDDSGDLVDGSLLTIGLNTYRLAYVDPAFDPSNPTMVTLTVVGSDSCVADLTHDGMVDGADLSILLQDWGTCPPKGGCPADFNQDGMVDGADLSILLEEWGDCP